LTLPRAQQKQNVTTLWEARAVEAEQFAQPPLLQVAHHGVSISLGNEKRGTRPLRRGKIDREEPAAAPPAMLKHLADPVGILKDPAPGQALIERH
jgi:hypothetical protein